MPPRKHNMSFNKESKSSNKKQVSVVSSKEEEKRKKKEEMLKKTMFSVNRIMERKKIESIQGEREKKLSCFEFDSSLPLTLIPSVLSVQENEQTLRVEIIKSPVPFNNICTNFIITPRGVVGSLRKNNNQEAVIGKNKLDENGQVYSDIGLHDKNSFLSRTHCKLIYGQWFKRNHIPLDFYGFLLVNHRSRNSLPQNVLRLIWKFIQVKKKIFICDMGSISGSFLKVDDFTGMELKTKMEFLISPYLGFTITEMFDSLNDFLYNYENRAILLKIFNDNIEGECNIYQNFIEKVFRNFLKNFSTQDLGALFAMGNLPCLKLDIFQKNAAELITQAHYFIIGHKNDKNKNFRINFGPTPKNNFKINCRASFEISYLERKKVWIVRNVTRSFQQGENLNLFGLWNSLSYSKERKTRYEPLIREIQNNDEFKISDTVFKIIC